MKRSIEDIRATLADRGIGPGVSVSWETGLLAQPVRYGCVLEILDNGDCKIVACNGNVFVSASALKPEPTITDPVMTDYRGTYGA